MGTTVLIFAHDHPVVASLITEITGREESRRIEAGDSGTILLRPGQDLVLNEIEDNEAAGPELIEAGHSTGESA